VIYFVRADHGIIKIGTTKNLSVRLFDLCAENRQYLGVLAVMDGERPEEQALHERFAHLRLHGEWFSPTQELLDFIETEGKPWDGMMAVPSRDTWTRKPLILQMRGSEKWKDWVERAAKFNRTTVANMIDMALTKFVRDSGFKEEPPER
jgi:hypothetical protein